ncbi:MAG: hypothetical protein SFZ23_03610 [Planctomycetota bacterium]|nr:hypothetical protein [Planctomycetota bacterium]
MNHQTAQRPNLTLVHRFAPEIVACVRLFATTDLSRVASADAETKARLKAATKRAFTAIKAIDPGIMDAGGAGDKLLSGPEAIVRERLDFLRTMLNRAMHPDQKDLCGDVGYWEECIAEVQDVAAKHASQVADCVSQRETPSSLGTSNAGKNSRSLHRGPGSSDNVTSGTLSSTGSRRKKRTKADKAKDEGEIAAALINDPTATRDQIAASTGIAPAHVSSSQAWQAHSVRRRQAQRGNRAVKRGVGGVGDPQTYVDEDDSDN